MKQNIPDKDRALKTLYVTGFNPKYITKPLLKELFTQGGPVKDITLFDTHAYILFEHEESVPYCLALFNEVELHGHRLRLNPRIKSGDAFKYLRYLSTVRRKLMGEYRQVPPPKLPHKKMPLRKQPPNSPNHHSKQQTNNSNKHPPSKQHHHIPKKSKLQPSKKSRHAAPKKFDNQSPRRSNKQPPKKSSRQPTKKPSKKPIKRPDPKTTKTIKRKSKKR